MKQLFLALTLALALPAFAQSAEDRIIAELARDGYNEIRRTRTFLGRVRLVATGNGRVREIVFNPSNGLILRDYVRTNVGDGDGDARSSDGPGVEAGNGPSRDDDDDDDDDDDGDDENGGDDDD